MDKMPQQEFERLLQQAVIVSNMMLKVLKMMHGEYRRKHVGAITEELLVAFVFWREDTIKKPKTILGAARLAGIPENNARRAIKALMEQGLLREVGTRYGRNTDFIKTRIASEYFVGIRVEVMKAGDALHVVWDIKKPRR